MNPTHTLQLLGKANLKDPLKEGRDYDIGIRGSVARIEKNIDTGEYTYKFKPLFLGYQTDKGERVILLPKGSHSKRLRGALWHYFEDNQVEGDYNDFYGEVIEKAIRNPKALVELEDE